MMANIRRTEVTMNSGISRRIWRGMFREVALTSETLPQPLPLLREGSKYPVRNSSRHELFESVRILEGFHVHTTRHSYYTCLRFSDGCRAVAVIQGRWPRRRAWRSGIG